MLESLIAEFRDDKHEFTVYRSTDQPEIEAWLTNRGVAVDSRPLPAGGPEPFIQIRRGEEFVGVLGVKALEGLLDPPIVRPGERDGSSESYRHLFEVLDKTVYSGMNRRELLTVSREIEDRAFRLGDGTLLVSFQTLSTFRSQTDVYQTLATETDLEIHIYGVGDWNPPEIDGITYHGSNDESVERYWVLAYDGGSDERQACGLVAREHANEYDGFWTNDTDVVEEIVTALRSS